MTIFENGKSLREAVEHRRQPNPYGCIYYSFAALTGETDLLKHERDCDWSRFTIRAFRKGYRMETLYADAGTRRARAAFWERFRDAWQDTQGWIPLMISIPSLRFEGVSHNVAVGVDLAADLCIVADSATDDLQEFDFGSFVASPYSDAYRVDMVQPAQLRYYAPYWGHENLPSPKEAVGN